MVAMKHMKQMRILRFVLFLSLLCATGGTAERSWADAASEVRDEVRIVLVPLADTQRVFERDGRGGYARYSAIVEDERANADMVIAVHSGNAFSPSLFTTIDSGAHAIDMLNRLSVSILSAGHHDFDFGQAVALRRFAEAKFPVLLSNAVGPDGGRFGTTVRRQIMDVAGYKLGFMGLLPRETATMSSPGTLRIDDPVATAEAVAGELRADGADVVIALADLDVVQADRVRAAGVDIVLAAQGPAETPSLWLSVNAKGVVARPAESGDFLPVIDLHLYRTAQEVMVQPETTETDEEAAEIDPDKFFETASEKVVVGWRADVRVRDSSRIEPDRFADTVIAQYYAQFSRQLNQPLATVTATFDTDRVSLRGGANGYGAFVTDSMRAASGADIALINAGAIRGDQAYVEGEGFRIRDLLASLPFRNRIIVLRLTGRQVAAVLEYAFSAANVGSPRFPQFSGMTVQFDPSGSAGKRLCAIAVGGRPLDMDATYRFATNEFLARGGDGYSMLAGIDAVDVGDLLQILRQRLAAEGQLQPVLDGRLKSGC